MADGPQTLYLNVASIAGNDVQPGTQLVTYSETRSYPVVPRASDYRASIVRFQCTGLDLPLFIPRIQVGQSDPNLTVYRLGITAAYNGVVCNASAAVSYYPDDMTAPVPPPPLTQQWVVSSYYYVHTYSHFLRVLNDTLLKCWMTPGTGCVSQLVAAGLIDAARFPCPWFSYEDGKLSINGPTLLFGSIGYIPSDPKMQRCGIWWNDALHTLLYGFPHVKYKPLQWFPSDPTMIYVYDSAVAQHAPPVDWAVNDTPLNPVSAPLTVNAMSPSHIYASTAPIGQVDYLCYPPVDATDVPLPGEYVSITGWPQTDPSWSNPVGGAPMNGLFTVTAVEPFTTPTPGYKITINQPLYENQYGPVGPPGAAIPTGNVKVVRHVPLGNLDLITTYTTDFNCTDAWCPIDAIVFTTTMPIVSEVQGTPVKLGLGDVGGNSSNDTVPSFTDLALDLSGGPSDYLQKITYVPSAQYRWLQFNSGQPINNINFTLMWRNRLDDALYPVYFRSGGSVSLKMLLERLY